MRVGSLSRSRRGPKIGSVIVTKNMVILTKIGLGWPPKDCRISVRMIRARIARLKKNRILSIIGMIVSRGYLLTVDPA